MSMVERFHVYLVGRRFIVKTNHLPLVSILKNPSAKLSAGLERLSLRLQQYVFDVEHIPGKTNLADTCRDIHLQRKRGAPRRKLLPPNSMTVVIVCTEGYDVEKAYKDDEQMDFLMLIAALRTRDKKVCRHLWKHRKLKPFNQIKEELTVAESNLVLRGPRLVVPEKAQMEVAQLAHRGLCPGHGEDQEAN
ncbi:uncharacterized protein LOC135369398 [Ornithodoros turicata]|uniref:uncharacterized protein LOC135369398 n=1 Tax=Ornithodoros turicata TaxID=34597 RepID=UPI0031397AC2